MLPMICSRSERLRAQFLHDDRERSQALIRRQRDIHALLASHGYGGDRGVPPAQWRDLVRLLRSASGDDARCNAVIARMIDAYNARENGWRSCCLGDVNVAALVAVVWTLSADRVAQRSSRTSSNTNEPSCEGDDENGRGGALLASVLSDHDWVHATAALESATKRIALLALALDDSLRSKNSLPTQSTDQDREPRGSIDENEADNRRRQIKIRIRKLLERTAGQLGLEDDSGSSFVGEATACQTEAQLATTTATVSQLPTSIPDAFVEAARADTSACEACAAMSINDACACAHAGEACTSMIIGGPRASAYTGDVCAYTSVDEVSANVRNGVSVAIDAPAKVACSHVGDSIKSIMDKDDAMLTPGKVDVVLVLDADENDGTNAASVNDSAVLESDLDYWAVKTRGGYPLVRKCTTVRALCRNADAEIVLGDHNTAPHNLADVSCESKAHSNVTDAMTGPAQQAPEENATGTAWHQPDENAPNYCAAVLAAGEANSAMYPQAECPTACEIESCAQAQSNQQPHWLTWTCTSAALTVSDATAESANPIPAETASREPPVHVLPPRVQTLLDCDTISANVELRGCVSWDE